MLDKKVVENLLAAVGLPPLKEIDQDTDNKVRSMPLKDFRKIIKKQGPTPGYGDAVPNTFLAGGAVLSWLNGTEVKDHDYFGHSINDCQAMVDYLLLKGFKYSDYVGNVTAADDYYGFTQEQSPLDGLSEKRIDEPSEELISLLPRDFSPKVETHSHWIPDVKSITDWYPEEANPQGKSLPKSFSIYPELRDMVRALNFWREGDNVTRQVILLIRGEPQEVIDTFDLSISQWAIDGETVYWGQHTLQDYARKRMRVVRIHHPMSTMRRLVKYANKGFWACNGAMLDAARALASYADQREAVGLDPLEDAVISLD